MKGRPEGSEMGGTFISVTEFSEVEFWAEADAAAAAVSRAAILWAASAVFPEFWASVSKSGLGFSSCEKMEVGVCCKR